MFPGQKIVEEYSSPQLKFPQSASSGSTGKPLQLDLFLPDLKLAFEFQGEHHFDDFFTVGGSNTMQDRDSEKRAICFRAGIVLVEISADWGGSADAILSACESQAPGIEVQSLSHG
jgi:hypothetical protein